VEFGERCSAGTTRSSNARVDNESREEINSEDIVLTLALSLVGWPILLLTLWACDEEI